MVPAWGGSRLAACLAKIMLSPYFRTAGRSIANRILYGCAARRGSGTRNEQSRVDCAILLLYIHRWRKTCHRPPMNSRH
jgi:hypothetical protein